MTKMTDKERVNQCKPNSHQSLRVPLQACKLLCLKGVKTHPISNTASPTCGKPTTSTSVAWSSLTCRGKPPTPEAFKSTLVYDLLWV